MSVTDDTLELPFDDIVNEEESQPEDELLRYLDDDVDEDEEAKKEREKQAEEDRLQAIVDRKIADRFTQPREESPAPSRREEPKPSPVTSAEDIYEKLADDIVNDMAADPKAAVKKLLQVTRTQNEQTTLTAVARANRIAIEQYRRDKASDPLFKAVAKDFDSVVDTYTDGQLGAATPSQVRKALEDVEDAAIGRYYKKQAEDRRQKAAEPPNYGGGSSNGRASGGGNRALTPADRTLIKMGKSAGLSDKDIREMLKEARR